MEDGGTSALPSMQGRVLAVRVDPTAGLCHIAQLARAHKSVLSCRTCTTRERRSCTTAAGTGPAWSTPRASRAPRGQTAVPRPGQPTARFDFDLDFDRTAAKARPPSPPLLLPQPAGLHGPDAVAAAAAGAAAAVRGVMGAVRAAAAPAGPTGPNGTPPPPRAAGRTACTAVYGSVRQGMDQ